MEIDEAAVARGERGDDLVHSPQVVSRAARFDADEVARVVAESRVVHRAEKNRADAELAQEAIQRGTECLDARARIGDYAACLVNAPIVAASTAR